MPFRFLLLAFMVTTTASAVEPVNFNRDIRPILADRCFHCHGPDTSKVKGDLRLDIEETAKEFAISPGDVSDSALIDRIISTDPEEHMPPPDSGKPRLIDDQVELFKRWITEGAVWTDHWAWESPERPLAPDGPAAIDHFIQQRLSREALTPSPQASKETLIRRASFDITGLPPTLEEIDTFLADESPDAFEKVLDRLFASEHYGERMAIDWLDAARYADTNGFQNDFGRDMHPWRDWVITAFNDNMPFDQFTIEQLAGDLLPNATESQRIATGFNRNHRSNTEGGSIEEEWLVENLVDRVETTGTVFLGLTVGCARCHDHKYDPVSQADFYRFFAFYNGTADRGFYEETRGNAGPQVTIHTDKSRARVARYDEDIDDARASLNAEQEVVKKEYARWQQKVQKRKFKVPRGKPALHLALQGDAGDATAHALTWSEGLLGNAATFDGSENTYIDAGTSVAFEKDQSFTIGAWVNRKTGGAIFSKMDDAAAYRGIDLLVTNEGSLQTHFVSEWQENAIRTNTEFRLDQDKWYHVAMTYDGSGLATGIRFYVNGAEVNATADTNKLSGSIHTDEPLRIGRRSNSEFFNGSITEFRVYQNVLDGDELSALAFGSLSKNIPKELSAEQRSLLNTIRDTRKDLEVADLLADLSKIERAKREYISRNVPTVMVMEEMETPRETYRLIRGAYDNPDKSETLTPDVPSFLPPMDSDLPKNRLGLAQWIVDPENPLTARVTVNRVWQKIFGQGLVPTAENFGTQSEPPQHPELLDWLATEFVSTGWDLKQLQKTIMMSATYRQNSNSSAPLIEKDPKNVLLARGPRFRMQSELVRDNALAVAGLLSDTIGGPAVKPYQPEGIWEELAGGASQGPYKPGEGDALYRRSLYTVRKRTVPHTTMSTFDAPSFELCNVKRARTNTPLQALALLNDTTYVEAARKLAERMINDGGDTSTARVTHGFRLATGRFPSSRELSILEQGIGPYREHLDTDKAQKLIAAGASEPDDSIDPRELAVYTTLASVILNLDETITKE